MADDDPEPSWRRRTGTVIHLQAPSGERWHRRLVEGEDPWQVIRWLSDALCPPHDLTWWVDP